MVGWCSMGTFNDPCFFVADAHPQRFSPIFPEIFPFGAGPVARCSTLLGPRGEKLRGDHPWGVRKSFGLSVRGEAIVNHSGWSWFMMIQWIGLRENLQEKYIQWIDLWFPVKFPLYQSNQWYIMIILMEMVIIDRKKCFINLPLILYIYIYIIIIMV